MLIPQPKQNGAPPPTTAMSPTAAAAILMCLAVSLFGCLDATAKYLITVYNMPADQVTWARFAGQFLGLLVFVPMTGALTVRALFTTRTPGWQIIRAILMAITTLFNFWALETLRLDQTVTIFFLTPLMVALVAGPLLGEWVGRRRMIAIVIGFIGILIAVRPGAIPVSEGVLFAAAAMMGYVFFNILTRHISGIDPPLVTLFYSMFAGVFLGAPFVLPAWVHPPDLFAWLLTVSLGVYGGVGHYFLILAHDRAPASTIAPFVYVQLIAMVALGYFVFNDLPDRWTLIGSSVVIASGLYLYHRERIRKHEA